MWFVGLLTILWFYQGLVFEEGGGSRAGSGIGFDQMDYEFHGAAKSAISWN